MKQGKIYNKIILGILLLVVICYMGYAVFSTLYQPLTTVRAIEYEAGEGYHCSGYVVRSETVITSPYTITVPERREGEKVGTGQVVATGYHTADAQNRQAEIEALNSQLEQLQYAASYDSDTSDTTGLDSEILASLISRAQEVNRRDLSAAADEGTDLKGLILRRSISDEDLSALQAQIDTLQSQLTQLQAAAGSDTMQIIASVSGYYSGTVDGYESVLTPERLTSLSVAELNALTPAEIPSNACGRIISESTWYYVAAVPSTYLADTKVGDQVAVSFSRDVYDTITMTVQRIGDEESGQRLLVLKSSDYIQDVTLLREQSADMIFQTYAGLRVPKEALRMQGDTQGVYILESASARWKPVTILYDNGESYVVELDKSSTNNLWPGDEIIVDAKNLYDGKVVIKS